MTALFPSAKLSTMKGDFRSGTSREVALDVIRVAVVVVVVVLLFSFRFLRIVAGRYSNGDG